MSNCEMVTVFVLHGVEHNFYGCFKTTDEIDETTGEFKLVADGETLEPGRCYDLPRPLADELLAMAAISSTPCVREPAEYELLSHRLASGELVVRD